MNFKNHPQSLRQYNETTFSRKKVAYFVSSVFPRVDEYLICQICMEYLIGNHCVMLCIEYLIGNHCLMLCIEYFIGNHCLMLDVMPTRISSLDFHSGSSGGLWQSIRVLVDLCDLSHNEYRMELDTVVKSVCGFILLFVLLE